MCIFSCVLFPFLQFFLVSPVFFPFSSVYSLCSVLFPFLLLFFSLSPVFPFLHFIPFASRCNSLLKFQHEVPPFQHLLSERLTSLGIRGAPKVPPLCRETLVSRTANVGTVGMNGLSGGMELRPQTADVSDSTIKNWWF